MLSFAHTNTLIPYVLIKDNSTYVTCVREHGRKNTTLAKLLFIIYPNELRSKHTSSNREDGRAPAKDAIKIRVRVAPRGTIISLIIGRQTSPAEEFARSKTSDKKFNMDLQASLQSKAYKLAKFDSFLKENKAQSCLSLTHYLSSVLVKQLYRISRYFLQHI